MIGKDGFLNLIIEASISVPPVVPPACITRPIAAPINAPPKIAGRSKSPVVRNGLGKNPVNHRATESHKTLYKDFCANLKPRCLILIKNRGIFKQIFVTHKGTPTPNTLLVTSSTIIEVPEIPPVTKPLGDKNQLIAKARRVVPNKIRNSSFFVIPNIFIPSPL